MGKAFADIIKHSLKQRHVIRFLLNDKEASKYGGAVMSIKRHFIVVREEAELEITGILILPKKSIRKYRCCACEECWNRIVRENGQLKKLAIPAWLRRCESLREVLEQMKDRDIWPALEMLHKKETSLYIGPIIEVARSSFFFQCYDAEGKWEKIYELRLGDIFRINFEDSYTRHFNDYMRRHESKAMLQMQRDWKKGE